jgi:hypothetical protein
MNTFKKLMHRRKKMAATYLEVGKVGDIVGRAHGVELEEGAALARHGGHLHRPLYVQLSLRVSLRTVPHIYGPVRSMRVADPDPYVFGSPGSGSVSTRRYGFRILISSRFT